MNPFVDSESNAKLLPYQNEWCNTWLGIECKNFPIAIHFGVGLIQVSLFSPQRDCFQCNDHVRDFARKSGDELRSLVTFADILIQMLIPCGHNERINRWTMPWYAPLHLLANGIHTMTLIGMWSKLTKDFEKKIGWKLLMSKINGSCWNGRCDQLEKCASNSPANRFDYRI